MTSVLKAIADHSIEMKRQGRSPGESAVPLTPVEMEELLELMHANDDAKERVLINRERMSVFGVPVYVEEG